VERKLIEFGFAVIHNILCGVNSLRIRSIEAVRNLAIDALTQGHIEHSSVSRVYHCAIYGRLT
jgi:hypothetical protein